MKKTTILPCTLILICFFNAFALGQEQLQEENSDKDSAENVSKKVYKNSFTLDPMNNKSASGEEEVDTLRGFPDRNKNEIKQYTLSPQSNEPIQRYNPNDDIHTLSGAARHLGGFGGLSFKTTQFDDKYIALAGARAGLIINRAVAIGVEGYGVIPSSEYTGIDPVYNTRLVGGYGGLAVEPILFSNKVVHVTFPVAGGAGWLGYIHDWEENDNNDNDDDDLVDGDVFWYVEPAIAMEINVTKFIRLNIGTSYRFIQDFQLINTESDAFDGWGYFLTFKFGRF